MDDKTRTEQGPGGGFVAVCRRIRSHWIYKDADYLKVWLEMMLCARWSKEPVKEMINGRLVTIGYAEFMFGRISWSNRLGISEKRLRKLVNLLLADNMLQRVTEDPGRKFTIYRLVNYEKFNDLSNMGQVKGQQETQDGQGIPVIEGQQEGQQRASRGPAEGHNQPSKPSKPREPEKEKDPGADQLPPKRKRVARTYGEDETPYKLAMRLLKWIKHRNPSFKEPNMQRWADEMRLLLEIDHRDVLEAKNVLDFSQKASWWNTRVLSPDKFRKFYDTLKMQMDEENRKGAQIHGRTENGSSAGRGVTVPDREERSGLSL